MSKKIGVLVPVMSSLTPCPLTGAFHVPKLYTKLLASAHGVLDPTYDECGKGYDQLVLNAFGADRDDVLAAFQDNEEKPTYAEFVEFLQDGSEISASAVVDLNRAISGHNHDPKKQQDILGGAGIEPHHYKISGAGELNLIEGLTDLHHQLATAEEADDSPEEETATVGAGAGAE